MKENQILSEYARGKIDLFEVIKRMEEVHSCRKKSDGVVYTPAWIVEDILNEMPISAKTTILEPSVGHGAFFIPALERATDGMSGIEALDWCRKHALGVDISSDSIEELKWILRAWFERRFDFSVDLAQIDFVRIQDGLSLGSTWDVLVGNPPYVRFQNLPIEARVLLQKKFKSCGKGNVDIYYAFLEHALEISRHVGMIVPNSFLKTHSGKALRGLMAPRIEKIVDFGARRVFENASTYTCLVFCGPEERNAGVVISNDVSQPFTVNPPRSAPVRPVCGPVATLCDQAFKVTFNGQDFVANGTGKIIEDTYVRPLIKITKAWSQKPETWTNYIIAPYTDEGVLVKENELKTNAPKTWAHLCAMRSKLDARDKGKTKNYPAWYAYGRAQGLVPAKGPQILAVPAMVGGKSLPFVMDISQFTRRPFLVSGFVVDNPSEEETFGFLSDSFKGYLKNYAGTKPGKGDELFYTVASWMVKGFSTSSE